MPSIPLYGRKKRGMLWMAWGVQAKSPHGDSYVSRYDLGFASSLLSLPHRSPLGLLKSIGATASSAFSITPPLHFHSLVHPGSISWCNTVVANMVLADVHVPTEDVLCFVVTTMGSLACKYSQKTPKSWWPLLKFDVLVSGILCKIMQIHKDPF